MRIDKWLWSVRLFKTRTLAAEEIKAGRVEIRGQPIKPSRDVQVGDIITVQGQFIVRTFKVLGLLPQRVGAPAVKEFMEELTPPEAFEKQKELASQNRPLFFRPKGMGRPTKKERRSLGHLWTDPEA